MNPPTLLRPAEAATRLGVTVKTLRRWADTGKIPYVRVGDGHRRYNAADIDRARHAA